MIKSLLISPVDIRTNVLSWEVDVQKGENIAVYRSDFPESGYKLLGEVSDSDTSYQDTITPDKHTIYYYKVFYDGQWYGPVHVGTSGDRVAIEVSRLINRHLQRDVGISCSLFQKMREGEHCSECWDDILERSVDPNCPVCHGTGYVGGYADPVQIKVVFPRGNWVTTINDDISEENIEDLKAFPWTGNYPVIKPGDILRRDIDKKMWRVNIVHRTSKRMFLLRQILILREVDYHEVENLL